MKRKFRVVVNGKEYTVEIEEIGTTQENVVMQAMQPVNAPRVETSKVPETPKQKTMVTEGKSGSVTAPMPGKILDVKVNVGDSVKAGDVLIILEAMKMENEIVAPRNGTVKEILVNPGDNVERGTPLVVVG